MPLAPHKADLDNIITTLQTALASCDADIAAADPESYDISRVRTQFQSALAELGLPGLAQ